MYGNAQYLNEAALLEKKWGQLNTLEGIDNPSVRKMTAVLLENQALANEKFFSESDSTGTSDIEVFRRITIPMVRRIYPSLIANKIVAVQPLLGPTGLVYYLRFRYGTSKGATVGSDASNIRYPNAGYDIPSMQQKADGTPVLDIWYTSQRVDAEPSTVAAVSNAASHTLVHVPVKSDSIEATGLDATAYGATSGNKYTVFGKAVQNGVTHTFYGTGTPVVGTPVTLTVTGGSATGTFSVTSGGVYAVNLASLGHATANTVFTVCYDYKMECNTDLPKVTMVVENEEIVAGTRKMKAEWSFEAAQDLRAQHNIDAEQELTSILAQEINLEIDREILLRLRGGAGTVAMWDYATALGDTIKEKYESLYVKVVEVSNIIMKKTLRGGANWIVTSPEVASIFETATAGFAPAPGADFESALGIQYVGTINNRWKLYKDPLFPTDQILLGFKGDNLMDTGFFYCPYIPLQMTPVVLDPNSFCPRKGILTRYGMKMLREGGKYYAVIRVANFTV